MKKVITPAVREESKFFCDKHPKRECFTKVVTQCWYGSNFDTLNLQLHLCDECIKSFYKYVKRNFGVDPEENENIFRCPLCHD